MIRADLPIAWKQVEDLMTERFGKKPDLEGILFLIGINEFGHEPPKGTFTKEQKQDLMHIAVCTLLEQKNIYRFTGRDADGWPHFELVGHAEEKGILAQEILLKDCITRYFGF